MLGLYVFALITHLYHVYPDSVTTHEINGIISSYFLSAISHTPITGKEVNSNSAINWYQSGAPFLYSMGTYL